MSDQAIVFLVLVALQVGMLLTLHLTEPRKPSPESEGPPSGGKTFPVPCTEQEMRDAFAEGKKIRDEAAKINPIRRI